MAQVDPRQRLQTALGSAYTNERELGGGGMSRVFLAEETTLGRQVVIKMLAPELPFGLPAYDPIRQSARFAAVIRAFGADPTPFIRPRGTRR